MLIYGPPGIGKTTLAGEFGKCFHMMFEPGGKGYSLYQRPILDWKDAVKYIALLEKQVSEFNTVCVDVIDAAYVLCMDWMITNKFGGVHPGKIDDRGSSWSMVRQEWTGFIYNLMNLPCGVVLLSHTLEKEVKRRDGTKYDTVTPSLTGQAWGVVEGLVDIIGYYGYEEDESRSLTIRGPSWLTTKCRASMFKSTGGIPIKSIPMGSNMTREKESHTNLIHAWEGKQTAYDAVPIKKGVKKPAKKLAKKKNR